MDKGKIKERILQWQLLGDEWCKEKIDIFIKKLNGDIHFCKIILIGETKITIKNYAPSQRAGKEECIDWLEIINFEKVRRIKK